jgi:hypothetical protein
MIYDTAGLKVFDEVMNAKSNCPFAIGTLVTGIDRSYERSIYRLEVDHGNGLGTYHIIAFRGETTFESQILDYPRSHSEMRVASNMEIKKASTRAHYRLIELLYKLQVEPPALSFWDL